MRCSVECVAPRGVLSRGCVLREMCSLWGVLLQGICSLRDVFLFWLQLDNSSSLPPSLTWKHEEDVE